MFFFSCLKITFTFFFLILFLDLFTFVFIFFFSVVVVVADLVKFSLTIYFLYLLFVSLFLHNKKCIHQILCSVLCIWICVWFGFVCLNEHKHWNAYNLGIYTLIAAQSRSYVFWFCKLWRHESAFHINHGQRKYFHYI